MIDLNTVPQVIEFEQALIGACLIEPECIADATTAGLKAGDFYLLKHTTLWDVLMQLQAVNAPTDVVTVCNVLKQAGQLEGVGGVLYITELMNSGYSTHNIPYYAEMIRRAAARRQLMRAADEIKALAANTSTADTETIIAQAQAKIAALGMIDGKQPLVSINDAANAEFKRLEDILEGKVSPSIPSSLITLKKLIKGYRRGELVVIAARMGVGKTTMMQTEAHYQARHGYKVVYACLEQAPAEITRGLICIEAGLPYDVVTEVKGMTEAQLAAYYAAQGVVSELPLWFADQDRLTLSLLEAKVKRAIAQHNADIVYVDYLGLMDAEGGRKNDNRALELSRITGGLKQLARSSGIPIVLAAQLNRDAAAGRPTLKDIKDSDGAAADGDVVIALWRDVDVTTPKVGLIETNVDVLKQRNGAIGYGKIGLRVPQKHFVDIENRTNVQN